MAIPSVGTHPTTHPLTHSIGVGIIGMGWMGTVHARAYRQIADRFPASGIRPKLIICADDVEQRAQSAAETFGFARATTDWRAVLDNPEVHVVNIAAPNFMHLELVRAAAAAGKHIFCEKPVGRTPEETAVCAEAARKAGVITFVGFNYRWAPMVQHTLNLIRNGELGALTHFRGRFFSMYGANPQSLLTWRFQQDKAGMGVLGDIMSHVIDMAHLLVGPIRRIISNRHTFITERPLPIPGHGTHFSVGQETDPKGAVTNEDYVGAMVEFENGVQGVFETCRAIVGPKCEMAFEINGTRGSAKWDFERMNELELYRPDQGLFHDGYTRLTTGPAYPFHANFNPGEAIALGYEDLKLIEAYQFLQSVVDDEQRAPSFADALALAKVQKAIMRSWESQAWEEPAAMLLEPASKGNPK